MKCPFAMLTRSKEARDATVKPVDHPEIPPAKTGVLLMNLGTPDATDYWSMRRYLSEFLSDRRVVETPRVFWQPLLQGIILTFRPKKSGRAYDKIWNREKDESPLRTIARSQAEKLAARFAGQGDVVVDWAMRYGTPSIPERIDALQEQGCTQIVLLALYPQYASATTATGYDKAFDALRELRWQPAVRTAAPYYDDPVYVGALASSIRSHLAGLADDEQPDVVLLSYHGLPQAYLEKGDPYSCQCAVTTRLLRDELGWDEQRMPMSFQSRFGPSQWLEPATDDTVVRLAKEGVKRIAVVCPGFSVDCVETLEEIAIGVREDFIEAGGTDLTMVPCLNDSDDGMALIEHLAKRDLAGWVG